MMSDYYKTLSKRVVIQVPDGASGFTETTTDTNIQGYISSLNGNEIMKSQKLALNATCRLFTTETLSANDRIVDVTGYFSIAGTVFEIVFPNLNCHSIEKYYDLKQI